MVNRNFPASSLAGNASRTNNGCVTTIEQPLLPTLKRYFGFDSFRPLQEEIITDSLAGRDVFALLPTGGGKSLCFQLPALIGNGLTVVVSPLIALMKDQVDAMQASGVPATFLNSTLGAEESLETSPRPVRGKVPPSLRRAGALDAGWHHRDAAPVECGADRHR